MPQDHVYIPALFEVDPALVTLDIFADPEIAKEAMELWFVIIYTMPSLSGIMIV
jgi:hypothetical protein